MATFYIKRNGYSTFYCFRNFVFILIVDKSPVKSDIIQTFKLLTNKLFLTHRYLISSLINTIADSVSLFPLAFESLEQKVCPTSTESYCMHLEKKRHFKVHFNFPVIFQLYSFSYLLKKNVFLFTNKYLLYKYLLYKMCKLHIRRKKIKIICPFTTHFQFLIFQHFPMHVYAFYT